MKTFYSTLLLFLFVLLARPTFGSHIMGVDITYECINACTTRIHLKGYRDCTGSNFINNTLTWTGCVAPNSINNWSPQVNLEVTPICPGYPTACNTPGATINGVQELSWHRDYDVCSVPPCVFTLQWTDCCRNPSITSLNNPGSQAIATSGTTINTTLTTCNNSPYYTSPPLFYACQGMDYDVHQGAFDVDGDSMAFSLGTCYQNLGTPVVYASGYSQLAPLGPSWNVTIDPTNGMVHLDASPGNLVIGVVCIAIQEYRNGNLIGTMQRDIQIVILPCGANSNPTFTAISNLTGGATAVGDHVYLPFPTPFCFDLGMTDVNSGQNLRMWWDDNTTTATFADATNGAILDTVNGNTSAPPTGRFCWTPTTNGTYSFRIRAEDDFCPIYGFVDKIITVHVGQCNGSTASATATSCPAATFSATTCLQGAITYTWSGAGGLSGNTAVVNHNYSGPGTYAWQVIVSNGTVNDTVQGSIVIGGSPSAATIFNGVNYVAPCTGNLYDTLHAGTWNSYLWSTGETTPDITVFLGGIYSVTVGAPNGCNYTDDVQLFWAEPDIYGVVTTSAGQPLQNQRILLIEHDTLTQSLWASDSTWTDSLGYYFFCNVTDTLAFLKATPNAFNYPTQMPTYADTTLFWNSAVAFYPQLQIPFQHDFSTLSGVNPGGPGFIGGLITQGANKTNAIGDPVPGLMVFLRNASSGAILGNDVTDINGYFSFPAIPLGDYEIVADKPLVSTTNVPSLTLNAQTAMMDSLDFKLHSTWLELVLQPTGLPTAASDLTFTAQPNPFGNSTRLNLELPNDAAVTIDVYDVLGKNVGQIIHGQIEKGAHRFDLGSGLDAGIYFVRLQANGTTTILKVLKTN